MPTRPSRFHGTFNHDGSVKSFQVDDEVTMTDPVTDEEVGTGNFITHVLPPDALGVFAALGRIGQGTQSRLTAVRARLTAKKEAQALALDP